MKRLLSSAALSLVLLALFGCAHLITMNTDLTLVRSEGGAVIDKAVGFHVPDSA